MVHSYDSFGYTWASCFCFLPHFWLRKYAKIIDDQTSFLQEAFDMNVTQCSAEIEGSLKDKKVVEFKVDGTFHSKWGVAARVSFSLQRLWSLPILLVVNNNTGRYPCSLGTEQVCTVKQGITKTRAFLVVLKSEKLGLRT